MKRQIILASSSPGRKEILGKTGLTFKIIPSDYEEDMSLDMKPKELAMFLSKGKVEGVAKQCKNALVIGADTFVVFEDAVLGKPHTPEKAKEVLQNLSGKSHSILTGLTIIDTDTRKIASKVAETKVYFRDLSDEEIERYVATGEPLDKAGAYAIQGRGATLVEKVVGDYWNVVGLPLSLLISELKEFNVELFKNQIE